MQFSIVQVNGAIKVLYTFYYKQIKFLPSAYVKVSPETDPLYAGKRQMLSHFVLDGQRIPFWIPVNYHGDYSCSGVFLSYTLLQLKL